MQRITAVSKVLRNIKARIKDNEDQYKTNWPRAYNVFMKKKSIEETPYVILPHQKGKIAWDFFVGGLIMESVIVVPLRLGFTLDPSGVWWYFDILFDVCFGVDMILTFFTAYELDSILVLEHGRISRNYLRSWFTVDFVSTFPFDLVIPLLLEGISPGALRSIKLVRALRLFRLLKLFRVARLNRKVKDAKVEESVHPVVYDLLGLFFWMFVMAHVLCCGFYYFSGCLEDSGGDSEQSGGGAGGAAWQECGKDDLTSKYILSMYWCVASILSVGYGDVYLTSNSGRAFSILVIFLGAVTFGLLVSTVRSSAKNWDRHEARRSGKMGQLREYLYDKKIPPPLRREITAHFSHYLCHKANASEEAIVLQMPLVIRQRALELTRGHILGMNFFKCLCVESQLELFPHLHPFLARSGDYIHREGEFCVDMFFLASGVVKAFKRQHDCGAQGNFLVGVYHAGSEFGLRRTMACSCVTWASYRACEPCSLYWLDNVVISRASEGVRRELASEAQREGRLMDRVTAGITTTEQPPGHEQGQFLIPSAVILNNQTLMDPTETASLLREMDASAPLRNVDSSHGETTTFRTVRVAGKCSNGQVKYKYQQESTLEMWHRGIINPFCSSKLYFDVIIAVMVLMSSLTVPYRMGFGITSTWQWSVIDGVTEVGFCLDVVLAFFTAYEFKEGTLDTSQRNIAMRYLRSWFVVDVLSAVPLYRITTGESSVGIVVRLLKTLKLGRLFRLFKMLKFARVVKLLKVSNLDSLPNEVIALEKSMGLLVKLLLFLGFTTHIIACVFSWISIHNEGDTWEDGVENTDNAFERYVAAQYWTYATMATVGYGDVVARNDTERAFSIVVMVLGSTGLAYVVTEMTEHVFDKGSGKGQQDHKLSISRDNFIQNATPQSWRDAMIKHFSYLMDKKTAFDDCLIWTQLPHSIRVPLISHLSSEDFKQIPLFNSVKPCVLCALYKYSEYCMLPQDSFMYTFQTGTAGLYFVLKGNAQVIDEKDVSKMTETGDPMIVIASIQEGMFFGHEVLLNIDFDFLGIRAKSDLYTLFIPNEKLARMKTEVPLIHETLIYIIQEAVKISFGTYDVPSNVGVLKRNASKLLQFRSAIRQKRPVPPSRYSPFARVLNRFNSWIHSDVDEAKSLYQMFGRKSVIAALKQKKKKIDEANKAVISDDSYEKFKALKLKKQRSVKRNRKVYASLYDVTEDTHLKYPQCGAMSILSHGSIHEDEDEESDEDDNVSSCDASLGKDFEGSRSHSLCDVVPF